MSFNYATEEGNLEQFLLNWATLHFYTSERSGPVLIPVWEGGALLSLSQDCHHTHNPNHQPIQPPPLHY